MTSLPTTITYGQVTGRLLLAVADTGDGGGQPDALPADARVVFTLTAPVISSRAPEDMAVIFPRPIECKTNENGVLVDPSGNEGVYLVATDDPNLIPAGGWYYNVKVYLEDTTLPFEGAFAVPADETVDLSLAFPNQEIIAETLTPSIVLRVEQQYAEIVSRSRQLTETYAAWAGVQTLAGFKSKLDFVTSNTPLRHAKVAFVGDSTTQGTGYFMSESGSYPAAFRGAMTTVAKTVRGLERPYSPITNTAWTVGSSWTYTSNNSLGPGFSGTVWTASTSTNPIGYKPSGDVTRIDLYFWRDANQGQATVTIAGVAQAPVSLNGAAGYVKQTYSGSWTAPQINVTASSGTVTLLGIDAYDHATPAVRVANMGTAGANSYTWQDAKSLDAIKAWAPDLTVIMLGVNDAALGVTPANHKLWVGQVALAAKASGDVLIVSSIPIDPTVGFAALLTSYAAEERALALELGVGYAFVDMAAILGPYDPLLMADGLHPNLNGYQRTGRLMAQVVLGAAGYIGGVGKQGQTGATGPAGGTMSPAQMETFVYDKMEASTWGDHLAFTRVGGIPKIDVEASALARANHTGTQATSTITGLDTALAGKASTTHTHPIAAGVVNVTTTTVGQTVEVNITFPAGRFSAAPSVTCTPDAAQPGPMAVSIGNVTANGATLRLYRNANGATIPLHWQAISTTF